MAMRLLVVRSIAFLTVTLLLGVAPDARAQARGAPPPTSASNGASLEPPPGPLSALALGARYRRPTGIGTTMDSGLSRRDPLFDTSSVAYLPATSDGVLDVRAVRTLLRSTHNGFIACYARGRRTNRMMAGRLVLEWTVVPSGRAVDVHATGVPAMISAEVATCFTRRVATLIFAVRPATPVRVTQAFILRALN